MQAASDRSAPTPSGPRLKALDVLLEVDREALCGPAYARGDAEGAVRWGRAEGRLVMGGQRVSVRKPRVRQNGREVELPTWSQFADRDLLNRAYYKGESFELERNGQVVARIVPAQPVARVRDLNKLFAVRTNDPTFADDLERAQEVLNTPSNTEDPWER